MQKIYVLDTNVLIQSPYALQSFEDNHVVLPLAVLEELDGLKNADGETGANARQAIRFLESLRKAGNLTDGVKLPCGGTLRLETNFVDVELPEGFPDRKNDNRILKVALGLSREAREKVILVTKDIVVRIKAQMTGIDAEDFTTEQAPVSAEQYTGRCEVYVPEQKFENFKKKGILPEDVYQSDEEGNHLPVALVPNQFVILKAEQSIKKTQLGRFNGEKIVSLTYKKKKPYGVSPRNVGQQFLQEALMTGSEEAPLVIVKGMAGTAKTFYALAAGLEKVLEENREEYRKLLICRPNAQFDQEIGFLPGSEQEKISPLLRPIADNLEILLDQEGSRGRRGEEELRGRIDYLFESGIITAEAMNFMRGRSITDTWLMIDEAQNLTPRQVKGIITRVGRGTKVILLGDPAQIDHPLLDEQSNGLSYAADRMRGSPLCVQLTMLPDECERSELALDAAMRM